MRRKSIGCIADKDLEALRAEMEGSNEKESKTEGARPGKDEPDSGVPESPQPRPGHRRSKSSTHTPSKMDWMDSIRELSTSPPDMRLPKGDHSASLAPGEASEKNTTALSSQVNIHPEEKQHSSTPKRPRGSVSSIFQPTLTPIIGTPLNSLQRLNAPPKWTRESSGEWVDSPTSPTSPVSPGERRLGDHERRGGAHSSRGTLVTSMDSDPQQPRTPQRRHHNKMNFLVSPGDAKRSNLHEAEPEDDDTFQLLHVPMSPKQKFASVSPTLLLRKLSLWGKNHKSSHASLSLSRTDSPPARIYVDFTAHSLSEESRDATPAPIEVPSKLSLRTGKVSSDEGVSTGPATPLPPNASSILSPLSDTCSSDGNGVFSPTQSITPVHSKRKRSFSSSTSALMVSRLEDQQRHDSVDGTRNYTVSYREERREKITTARLVRILDLSSNSLSQLEGMVGLEQREHDGERGEVVLRRLKGLHRLDLKQNQLSRLPRLLMEGLKKLSILNLSCNHFDKMPSECVLSPALTYLNISSNRVGGVIVC